MAGLNFRLIAWKRELGKIEGRSKEIINTEGKQIDNMKERLQKWD